MTKTATASLVIVPEKCTKRSTQPPTLSVIVRYTSGNTQMAHEALRSRDAYNLAEEHAHLMGHHRVAAKKAPLVYAVNSAGVNLAEAYAMNPELDMSAPENQAAFFEADLELVSL